MAWVEHMVKSMNSNGRMAVVLPHGALFRKGAEGKIRRALLKQGFLEAVIGHPKTYKMFWIIWPIKMDR